MLIVTAMYSFNYVCIIYTGYVPAASIKLHCAPQAWCLHAVLLTPPRPPLDFFLRSWSSEQRSRRASRSHVRWPLITSFFARTTWRWSETDGRRYGPCWEPARTWRHSGRTWTSSTASPRITVSEHTPSSPTVKSRSPEDESECFTREHVSCRQLPTLLRRRAATAPLQGTPAWRRCCRCCWPPSATGVSFWMTSSGVFTTIHARSSASLCRKTPTWRYTHVEMLKGGGKKRRKESMPHMWSGE